MDPCRLAGSLVRDGMEGARKVDQKKHPYHYNIPSGLQCFARGNPLHRVSDHQPCRHQHQTDPQPLGCQTSPVRRLPYCPRLANPKLPDPLFIFIVVVTYGSCIALVHRRRTPRASPGYPRPEKQGNRRHWQSHGKRGPTRKGRLGGSAEAL